MRYLLTLLIVFFSQAVSAQEDSIPSPRKEGASGKVSMRDRVDNAERSLSDAELRIEQQATMIDDLKSQNADLVRAISVFKTQLEESVAVAVEAMQKDMRVKHGILKAKKDAR